MVIVTNKSNKPIGVGKQFCLPDQKMELKDRDAFCEVFDEYGNATGKKQILPGLKAIERLGHITIEVVEEKKPEKVVPVVEEPEEKKAPRKRATKKTAE